MPVARYDDGMSISTFSVRQGHFGVVLVRCPDCGHLTYDPRTRRCTHEEACPVCYCGYLCGYPCHPEGPAWYEPDRYEEL